MLIAIVLADAGASDDLKGRLWKQAKTLSGARARGFLLAAIHNDITTLRHYYYVHNFPPTRHAHPIYNIILLFIFNTQFC